MNGKKWTQSDLKSLAKLIKLEPTLSTLQIGEVFGRSQTSIAMKMKKLGYQKVWVGRFDEL